MQRILGDIKSVPGVAGVVALDKGTLQSYQLLPATFSSASIRDMGTKLLRLSENMSEQSRLDLKFEHGIGLVYNLEHSVILIFGRADLNFSVLGFVLKWALQAIERKLATRPYEPVRIQASSTWSQPSQESGFVVDKEALRLLIEAVNLVAKSLVKTHGNFWVAQNLRKSKEMVVREFPFVAGFYVDNNATISLMKGGEGIINDDLTFALIKWIYLFMNSSSQTQSLGVRDLTARISHSLEEIGFYSMYQRLAEGRSPKR